LADVCIMQNDGNLVIYDPDARAIWSSGTYKDPGSRLVMQNDGNVVIYRPDARPVWSTVSNAMVVHFKTLVPLTATIQTFINTQFAAMDELYIDGRVNVAMGTIEDLSGTAALAALASLNVGNCTIGTVTGDQNTLFSNRNNVGANDIVVYLASTLIGGAGNFVGCASHPNGQPGCAIVQVNANWLTAHEIGHVLGLSHVSTAISTNSDFLMWPTIGWTNPPPDLSQSEFQTMRNSPLTPVV